MSTLVRLFDLTLSEPTSPTRTDVTMNVLGDDRIAFRMSRRETTRTLHGWLPVSMTIDWSSRRTLSAHLETTVPVYPDGREETMATLLKWDEGDVDSVAPFITMTLHFMASVRLIAENRISVPDTLRLSAILHPLQPYVVSDRRSLSFINSRVALIGETIGTNGAGALVTIQVTSAPARSALHAHLHHPNLSRSLVRPHASIVFARVHIPTTSPGLIPSVVCFFQDIVKRNWDIRRERVSYLRSLRR